MTFHEIQYRGDNIYDAGILESMQETNCDTSVLVSPFAGPRATICPPDEPSKWTKSLNGQTVYINWDNYRRGTQAMQVLYLYLLCSLCFDFSGRGKIN